MFTTHYTLPTDEMNVRDYADSILFGSAPLTIVLTKAEALNVIIGMMPFLDDDALSRIVLTGHAIDDERHGCEPPEYKDEDPDEYTQALIDAEPEVRP